jgi:hypothetical protein
VALSPGWKFTLIERTCLGHSSREGPKSLAIKKFYVEYTPSRIVSFRPLASFGQGEGMVNLARGLVAMLVAVVCAAQVDAT